MTPPSTGLFYGGGLNQFVVQIVIALVAVVFTGVVTMIIALASRPRWVAGATRDEARGIDETEHAETAYELT